MSNNTYPKKEEFMAQSTKILIVFCLVLVAGLGITAGALKQMNKQWLKIQLIVLIQQLIAQETKLNR